MRLRFSPHALVRMRERGVWRRDVRTTIERPDRLSPSTTHRGRFLAVRGYRNQRLRQHHALLVVYEQRRYDITVVTVIDTSKVAKYV